MRRETTREDFNRIYEIYMDNNNTTLLKHTDRRIVIAINGNK